MLFLRSIDFHKDPVPEIETSEALETPSDGASARCATIKLTYAVQNLKLWP